jgi:hypothetical protein
VKARLTQLPGAARAAEVRVVAWLVPWLAQAKSKPAKGYKFARLAVIGPS